MFSTRVNSLRASASAFLLLVCMAGADANSEAPPSADGIVQKLLARQKGNHAAAKEHPKRYAFTQRIVKEKLDAEGMVSAREDLQYQVAPVNGILTPRLVLKNGKPPTPADLKAEEERMKKERREAEQRNRSRNEEEGVEFNEDLAAKYKYTLLGEATILGRTAYTIAFQPRSNDLPVNRRADYVLNHVVGKAWIDREDFELAKVELHLTEKASFWLGILGTLRDFSASFEQQRMPDGLWLPSHFTMHIDGRILFNSLRERQEGWWSDYYRLTQDATKKTK